MPLIRLLQNSAFEPEFIDVMSAAFQQACNELGLAETDDPLREIVARKIIECAQGRTGRGLSRPGNFEQVPRVFIRDNASQCAPRAHACRCLSEWPGSYAGPSRFGHQVDCGTSSAAAG